MNIYAMKLNLRVICSSEFGSLNHSSLFFQWALFILIGVSMLSDSQKA